MFFKNRCYNGGNKHKFEPRYTETPDPRGAPVIRYFNLDEVKRFRTLYVYEKDVCVWCGKEIKK